MRLTWLEFNNEAAGPEPQPAGLTTKIRTSIVTLESILSQKFEIYRLSPVLALAAKLETAIIR